MSNGEENKSSVSLHSNEAEKTMHASEAFTRA